MAFSISITSGGFVLKLIVLIHKVTYPHSLVIDVVNTSKEI